jgi:hypothetical protein
MVKVLPPTHVSMTMNPKPLVSAAPTPSILSAKFRYTNSTATDIRKTFARVRREQAKAAVTASAASNVRPLTRTS